MVRSYELEFNLDTNTISSIGVMSMGLFMLPKYGRKTVRKYLSEFPDNTYWNVDKYLSVLLQCSNTAVMLSTWDKILLQIDACKKENVRVICYFDDNYPERLKHIEDPPLLLYVKGNADILHYENNVAIIGTRTPTDFGMRAAKRVGKISAEMNYVVVSGLARGCDTFGFQGSVDHNGKCIAVLAHGLDMVYPKENTSLAENILSNDGCLISEYPVGTKLEKWKLFDRDRLQSALSDAVLVIETDIEGGTMHTVGFALKQKKYLLCINHPKEYLNEEKTRGNQKLIKEGVKLISNHDEFREYLIGLHSNLSKYS